VLKDETKIPYDKILLASSYAKHKLDKNYSNVLTIED